MGQRPVFLSISDQTCSIGLRSGLLAGQSTFSVLFSLNHLSIILAVWHGAPSCWNMHSSLIGFRTYKDGISWFSKISRYPLAFNRPLYVVQHPTPSCPMKPHTPIEPPPPWTRFCTKRSSYFSWRNRRTLGVVFRLISWKLDSSLKIIWAHFVYFQSFRFLHQASLLSLWSSVSSDFLAAT